MDPFSYGDAPMQRLANVAFNGQPVANRQCVYTLGGLALLYPNNITFPPPVVGANGSLGEVAQYLKVAPENWTSPVLPSIPGAPNPATAVFAQGAPGGW